MTSEAWIAAATCAAVLLTVFGAATSAVWMVAGIRSDVRSGLAELSTEVANLKSWIVTFSTDGGNRCTEHKAKLEELERRVNVIDAHRG